MEKIPNNTEPEVESEAELAPEPEAEPIPKADAEKSPKIKTRSVVELEEPIRVLFEQLSSKFEQGEYTYIVGDDASGRIPALIFEEVAKKISERSEVEPPKLYFIAGSRQARSKEESKLKTRRLREYIAPTFLNNNVNGRVLIVTDTLTTGSGLIPLAKVFNECGVPFDIATVGIHSDSVEKFKQEYHELSPDIFTGNIYAGSFGIPLIYEQSQLSGVRKESIDVLAYPLSRSLANTALLKSARQDVHIVADKVFTSYRLRTNG